MNLSEKYRPLSFKEVIGQKTAIMQLEGFLKKDFPSTLFIFGNSGYGKTCLARILAAKLAGIDYTGYSSIDNCPDIQEVNMGDKRGVEDARKFAESSLFKPVGGKNRVFLLDEIHAVTQTSANALLKVMENPPATTKFIGITNNPQQLLYTLKRRGPNITLVTPDIEDIQKLILRVNKKERADIDKRVLARVLKAADHSPSLALNILSSVISISTSGGTVKDQIASISEVKNNDIETIAYSFVMACYTGEISKAMNQLYGNKIPIVEFCTKALDVNAMLTHHMLEGTTPDNSVAKTVYNVLKKKAETNKINGNAKMWLHFSLSDLRSKAMNNQMINDNHDLLAILLKNQK